jgi:protoheme ferro-lyase
VTHAARRGVLLMTYGSPASLQREDIRDYLARVRGGREPDTGLVEEFTRRYRVIGG